MGVVGGASTGGWVGWGVCPSVGRCAYKAAKVGGLGVVCVRGEGEREREREMSVPNLLGLAVRPCASMPRIARVP